MIVDPANRAPTSHEAAKPASEARLTQAIGVFDETRALYSPEKLSEGVYVEVHGDKEGALLGLLPQVDTHLPIKFYQGSHSVFANLVRGNLSGDSTAVQDTDELVERIVALGFTNYSVTARGLYIEDERGHRIRFFSEPRDLDGGTITSLCKNFGITELSVQEPADPLYADVSGREHKIDLNGEPDITGWISMENIDTESEGEYQVGNATRVELKTRLGIDFSRPSRDYVLYPDVEVNFASSFDRSHTVLAERQAQLWVAEDARLPEKHRQSDAFMMHVTDREAHRVRGTRNVAPLGGTVPTCFLGAQFTLRHVQRELTIEAKVNPEATDGVRGSVKSLARLAMVMAVGMMQGFYLEGFEGYRLSVVLNINHARTDPSFPEFYTFFEAGCVDGDSTLTQLSDYATKASWQSIATS